MKTTQTMTEKEIIIETLKKSADMPLKIIANNLGLSLRTFLRRLDQYNIKHGRKRGVRKGTHLKPLKLT